MAELLIAVAIIVILLGLAGGFFISIQRNVRQKQMDDIAQEIYMVAQNEMMRIRYTGQLDAFNTAEVDNGVKTLKYAPSDSNVATQMANGTVKLNRISAADSVVAGMMLPSGALDEGIRANKWIIEYDSLSGTVYSVFYSEKVEFTLRDDDDDYSADTDYVNATSYPNVTYDQLRDNPDGSSNAGTRKSKTKGYIGYYGRGSAWGEEAKDLDVSMFVDNAEELTLFISYNEPMIKSGVTSVSDPIQRVELVVTDLDVSPADSWSLQADAVGSGTNTVFQNYVPDTVPVKLSNPVKNAVTNRLETGLVLDSILSGNGFKDITGMNVGDNISITLKVTTKSGIIGETTVKTNSGFESKTVGSGIDNDTITVSYGRHLQNLNDYISTEDFDVKQTKDILFGEVTGDASTWYAKYFLTKGIRFVPLHVPGNKIKSYDGSSDGQDFLISDMILEAKDDKGNIGMFGTFSGESLKNIRMVNTQIGAPGDTSSVGCIAGETDSLKTLENCYVYLTDEFASSKAQSPYDITKVPYFIRGGKNTGSLIGKVSGTQELAVTNCFGSTSLTSVINESDAYAGGLFGFVGTDKKVTIQDSYADSYVKGYNTAGLVGGIAGDQALDIDYCYAAGFNYTYGHSAGFVLGTSKNAGKVEASDNANANLTMAHAYSIVYQAVDKDVTLASVTKDFITNVNKSTLPANNSVFYCGTATDIRCQGSPVSTMDNAAFLKALNGTETDKRFAFQDATSTTSPYNLIDNGLTEYTYPVVLDMDYRKNKDVAGGARILHHFGDWKAEFAKGLVYYEKYADNTYGFYGSNTSLLVHDKTIVADGYALAMSENDYEGIKSNPQVSVGFNGNFTAKTLKPTDEKTVIFNDTIKVTDPVSGDTYVLVPLDYVIDSKLYALEDQGEFAPEDFFYYAIRLDSDVFYFNPYFAKTAKSVTGEKSATTDGKTLTENDIKNAELTKSKVRASVRTARQLHELSENKTYWDKEYLSIVQELNIDYTAYRGYSQVESAVVQVNDSPVPEEYTYQRIFTEEDFSKDGSIMAVQKPIGTGTRPFRAQYDGSGCEIFGVYLVDTVVQKANTLIGLFGQNEGIIKNVTLNGNYTLGTSTTNNVYGFSNGNINGSGTSVYMGALVGYNGSHGLIDNCAVTGYKPASRITVSDTSSGYSENIQTYQNSYLYIGGMVGANDGTISKCSSDVPKVHVESTAAYVYAGAFTGYNMGSVSNAYAFSRLYGTLDTSLNAYYAGFAGWNSGTIQRAYCATSITVGDRAEKNSFTNNRGTVKDCFFINNVNGSYSGKVYAYYDETPSPVASEITAFEDLASPDKVSIQGFSKVADASATMIHPFNQGEINNVFPYPAVVTRNGKTVSIGNWPITANLGEVGVIYWEHEVGGSNAGWYFSAVDSADRKQSTLCEEHDDGGVITEYGYGYFYEASSDDSKTWEIEKFSHLNLNQDDTENMASRNASAEAALAEAMPGYQFVAFTSGQGKHNLRLTEGYPTSTKIVPDGDSYLENESTNVTYTGGTSWEYNNLEKPEDSDENGKKRTISDNTVESAETMNGLVGTKHITRTIVEYYKSSSAPTITDGSVPGTSTETTSASLEYTNGSILWSENNNNYSELRFPVSDPVNTTIYISDTKCFDYGNIYFALKKVRETDPHDVIIHSGTQKTYWKFGRLWIYDRNSFVALSLQENASQVESLGRLGYYYKKSAPTPQNGKIEMEYRSTTYYYYKKTTEYKADVVQKYKYETVIGSDKTFTPNGSITLNTENAEGHPGFTFVISPFFGDSLGRITEDNGLTIENYGKTEETQYYIRNINQLQFINWNSVTNDTRAKTGKSGTTYLDSLSQDSVNQGFTYLRFTDPNHSVEGWDYNFYWKQTHDIGRGNKDEESDTSAYDFTPIGCLYDALETSSGTYKGELYIAFFGGQYDGNQYEIKNLNITSGGRQCTGLFGITMGANLKNIIMYSPSGQNTIQNELNDTRWYTLGGLVGFAAKGQSDKCSIANCSVAGYQIIDNRKNSGGNGGANIGGLLGATNMRISGCTAVTNITLDSTYLVKYNNIRVGGITGCLRNTMSECYSGGSISLGENLKNAYGPKNDQGVGSVSSIWIGGLSGGVYMKVDGFETLCGPSGDISTKDGSPDEEPLVENCYTYMKLPEKGKYLVRNVQSLSSIGEFNAAFALSFDGKTFGSVIHIRNCYAFIANQTYLDPTSKKQVTITNDYDLLKDVTNWQTSVVNSSSYRDNKPSERKIWIDNSSTGHSPYLSYEQMANSDKLKTWLGDSFGKVTVEEDGVTVNGKYSFPSSSDLKRKNYPFPTILKQTKDNVTYNVHYGDWPGSGISIVENPPVLEDNVLYIDLFEEKEGYGMGKQTFQVELVDITGEGMTVTSDDENIVTVSLDPTPDKNGRYVITATGKKPGAATVTIKKDIYEAFVTVVVSAELKLVVPKKITVYAGAVQSLTNEWQDPDNPEEPETKLTYKAVSAKNSAREVHGGTWKVFTQDTGNLRLSGTLVEKETFVEGSTGEYQKVFKNAEITSDYNFDTVQDTESVIYSEVMIEYQYVLDEVNKITVTRTQTVPVEIVKPYRVTIEDEYVGYVVKEGGIVETTVPCVIPIETSEIGNFGESLTEYEWVKGIYSDEDCSSSLTDVLKAEIKEDSIVFEVAKEPDTNITCAYVNLIGRRDLTHGNSTGQTSQTIIIRGKIDIVQPVDKNFVTGYNVSGGDSAGENAIPSKEASISSSDVDEITFTDYEWTTKMNIVTGTEGTETASGTGNTETTSETEGTETTSETGNTETTPETGNTETTSGTEGTETTTSEEGGTVTPEALLAVSTEYSDKIVFNARQEMTGGEDYTVEVDLYGKRTAEGENPYVHIHVVVQIVNSTETYRHIWSDEISGGASTNSSFSMSGVNQEGATDLEETEETEQEETEQEESSEGEISEEGGSSEGEQDDPLSETDNNPAIVPETGSNEEDTEVNGASGSSEGGTEMTNTTATTSDTPTTE